ncbi:MAG: hypothetical protein F6K65_26870, partial [Moorea sp. SIO3C2]|nr:hypothetical protein [Moorena sp. SIO3C2]
YTRFVNYLYKQGFDEEAVFLLTETIRISPEIPEAYVTLAAIRAKQNRTKEASKNLAIARDLYTKKGMDEQASQINIFLNR